MTSLKKANRRVGSLFAVAALAFATLTPGLVPAFASAAQISERSVQASSSAVNAEDVSYDINFKTETAGAAVVFEFCSDSPLVDTACAAPADLDLSAVSATIGVSGGTLSVATDALTDDGTNAVAVTGAFAAGNTQVVLDGVTNPSVTGAVYVRIVTYTVAGNAADYESTDKGSNVGDTGSAAISITDNVNVSGEVLESMTFCVSGAAISANCAGTTAPAVELQDDQGDVAALSSSEVRTGSIYTQISTNANGGATVNLRSSATGCGGLILSGHTTDCNIGPAALTDNDQTNSIKGKAVFGIKVIGATADADGAFGVATGADYVADAFFLNYGSGDNEATGVTSPYGDPVLDTAGAPANNKNAQITFGASIANNTPAGRYSADFSLIATGKF